MADTVELKDGKLTQDEFNKMTSGFNLDMIAFFSLLQEQVMKKLGTISKEQLTPAEISKAINEIADEIQRGKIKWSMPSIKR